ncbi:MAG: glycosyltransferase, partial [Deltaproteobacteria bacterium]|nr:glycosyltransferase [Deltaproteobacteria bacterium]
MRNIVGSQRVFRLQGYGRTALREPRPRARGVALALRERGVRVQIFSLKPPSEPFVHEAAQSLLHEVIYPPSLWQLLVSQLRCLVRQPIPWLLLLGRTLREAWQEGRTEMCKALYTVAVATHFARVARWLGIGHLHAHWATYPALAVRTIQTLTGIPYTLTTHAHDIFLPNPYLAKNLASARTVVTISEYNRRYLVSAGTPASKIKVIRCGLDLREFSVQRATGRRADSIVAIGRLEPIKGFSFLLEACALLKNRGSVVSCSIIGDGSLRGELERQILANNLQDQVHLLGALSQSQVREVLASAALFVL